MSPELFLKPGCVFAVGWMLLWGGRVVILKAEVGGLFLWLKVIVTKKLFFKFGA